MPDAAERVGYHSESAFAQAFKRVTGVQPGAYRRRADHHAEHRPAAMQEPPLVALH
jgi:AraC-like DNA-binding protein